MKNSVAIKIELVFFFSLSIVTNETLFFREKFFYKTL
jgi:hypothetical protein